MSEAAEPSLILRREGEAGRIIMNRPKALNALDQEMIDAFARAIAQWKDDPAVKLVVLEGAGGRAFCAGGDVRAIRKAAIEGDTATIERFFSTEYAVNLGIATFGKPWVSVIDGVCMGGGIGVSVHGSHRVATMHATFAMPETIIALFPDVGGSYALPRLPGAIGMWLALTGARLNGRMRCMPASRRTTCRAATCPRWKPSCSRAMPRLPSRASRSRRRKRPSPRIARRSTAATARVPFRPSSPRWRRRAAPGRRSS